MIVTPSRKRHKRGSFRPGPLLLRDAFRYHKPFLRLQEDLGIDPARFAATRPAMARTLPSSFLLTQLVYLFSNLSLPGQGIVGFYLTGGSQSSICVS
jgi:hypothetical protein